MNKRVNNARGKRGKNRGPTRLKLAASIRQELRNREFHAIQQRKRVTLKNVQRAKPGFLTTLNRFLGASIRRFRPRFTPKTR